MVQAVSNAPADAEKLGQILTPYASNRVAEAKAKGTRFVHYTSAEAAVQMLKHKRMWMRNAMCMNDYSEVRFGVERVFEAYASPPGQRFQQALNAVHPGFTDKLKAWFDPNTPTLLTQTYVSCFSEHLDDEDEHGRLSMWRAYGSQTGVAVVMNNHKFVSPSDALNAWTSPVAYVRGVEYIEELDKVATNVEQNREWLSGFLEENLLNSVILMLVFAAVSLKHVGFSEEREWRVVHLPALLASEKLEPDHAVIGGVPQPIFKIPMANYPEHGFTGAEPNELIDRIIIGPSQYPVAVRTSFIALLKGAGIEEPNVVCSGIPLRC